MYIKLCRTHFDTVPHSYLVLKTEILKVGNLRPNMTLICWKLLYSEKNKHVRLKFVKKVVHKCIPFFFWKDVICISSYAAHTSIPCPTRI